MLTCSIPDKTHKQQRANMGASEFDPTKSYQKQEEVFVSQDFVLRDDSNSNSLMMDEKLSFSISYMAIQTSKRFVEIRRGSLRP